ncbi:MAG: phosphoribosylanthranilate isomerase [bacterium]
MATTKIKICGITNTRDALYAEKKGAAVIGFIFAKSPRQIEPIAAAGISKKLRGATLKAGIFVNEKSEKINATVVKVGLTMVQLQGKESIAQVKKVKAKMVVKGIRVKTSAQVKTDIKKYEKYVDGFVFDGFVKNIYGGTGKKFDWKVLKAIKIKKPFFLAGGIGPENAVMAVKSCQPWGLDISSGVEKVPGKKDHKKIDALFKNIKSV